MRDKIRRMSIIVYMLQRKEYNIEQLQSKLEYITDRSWSRSIIDKDISMLKHEFDCPIVRVGHKLTINQEYSFVEKFRDWVEFYI